MKKNVYRDDTEPPKYEIRRNGGQRQLLLYVNVREEDGDESREKGWVATQLVLPPGEMGYGAIVSALINGVYDADAMQAIVNNKLLGDASHDGEYEAMQEWRAEAKRRAKRILEEVNVQQSITNS